MKKTVIFAGGGTGGHVYPALSVANVIKKQNPEIDIHFVGSQDGIESKLVPREGYPLHLVKVGRLNNMGTLRKLKTLLGLPFAIIHSWMILGRLNPQWVLGVGGFASGPFLIAAWLRGIDIYLWEANAYPGMVNRALAGISKESFVVFEDAIPRMKSKKNTLIGMPIRQEIEDLEFIDSTRKPLKILVFGGSQGARGINNIVAKAVQDGGEWLEEVEILHQTGPYDYERIKTGYETLWSQGLAKNVQVFDYLFDMPDRYKWADFVVCRGGASTISELAACGKASLIIPFPHAADNHQQKNAEALVQEDAAFMEVQAQFTVEKLKNLIKELKQNPQKIDSLGKNIKTFHRPQAAKKLASQLVADL